MSTETTESIGSTEVTTDCRSWSEMEYFGVKEDGDDTLVIKNDAENHNHRLNSWIKVSNVRKGQKGLKYSLEMEVLPRHCTKKWNRKHSSSIKELKRGLG